MTMNAAIALRVSLALPLLACSESSGSKPDLPPGWEGAQTVSSFTQAACGGSADAPDAPSESIEASATPGSVRVAYHAAHFRCAQSVEGFMRASPGGVDFLVQPTDMNPSRVAGCDCLYEVTLASTRPAGPTTITLYRRWDNQSGASDPLEIGTAMVTVP
jgi:hypothetical protein